MATQDPKDLPRSNSPKTPASAPQGRVQPETRTVREWTAALEARPSVVAGAGYVAGWTADTRLTRAEFEAGVAAYENTPMGGNEAQPKVR
jgi:hypothetical protein